MKKYDILILTNNNFTNIKEKLIKSVKIIKKDNKYLTSIYLPKFKISQIKLNSNSIIVIKKSFLREIFLVKYYIIDLISF